MPGRVTGLGEVSVRLRQAARAGPGLLGLDGARGRPIGRLPTGLAAEAVRLELGAGPAPAGLVDWAERLANRGTRLEVCGTGGQLQSLVGRAERLESDRAGPGRIQCIVGPMFAGKTTELIGRVRRARAAGGRCLVFKYAGDTRSGPGRLKTHDGLQMEAVPVPGDRLAEVAEAASGADVLAVDEAQFFQDLDQFVLTRRPDQTVIVAGLDGSFEREPFGRIPQAGRPVGGS